MRLQACGGAEAAFGPAVDATSESISFTHSTRERLTSGGESPPKQKQKTCLGADGEEAQKATKEVGIIHVG
jgi:hypothetical protein